MNQGRKGINYDRIAEVYDQTRSGNLEMVRLIIDGAPLTAGALVLDVGCGTGNNTILFAGRTDARVVGVDISAGMIKRAREKSAGLALVQGNAESLPFRGGVFDLSFMTEVIHLLDHPFNVLSQVYRVLAPGGRLCIVTQSHEQIDRRMTSRFFPASAEIDKQRFPPVPELCEMLQRIGFSGVESQTYKFPEQRIGKEFLQTVRKRGFSMLHKIGRQAYEKGVRELEQVLSEGTILTYVPEYTFVWAQREQRR